MKENMIEKKRYSSPIIEIVKLDYEISLQLASNPPGGTGENPPSTMLIMQNDPYKNQIG
jgi:hypothetical protein